MNEDGLIVEAVRQGNRDRFVELVERHKRMVYGIAWSYLGNVEMCEDAAQETFIKAYRYLGTLRKPERFPAWIAKIARNVSATILRKRNHELENMKRWQAEQSNATAAAGDIESTENLEEMLGRNLEALEPRNRECLVLFYMEGKNIRETAGALGLSEEAVKTRLHRARRVLRGRLEAEIEREFKVLGPRKNFTASIMFVLPQPELLKLGAGGGVTLFSKAAGWLGNVASMLTFLFWMALAQTTIFYLFMRWFVGLESKNLIDKPENKFRKALLRQNLNSVAIVALLCLLSTWFAVAAFGHFACYSILTIFCAWGFYRSLRHLRVNRSPYALGQMLANFIFLTTFVLMGFFGAPRAIFFLALALLNLVLAFTNLKMPRRHDYNLFLRQAQGTLGQPRIEYESVGRATTMELRAFARFLGEQWLIRDYSIKRSTILMRLSPVRMTLTNSILMTTVGESFIRIVDGHKCQAFLSRSDADAIAKLTEARLDIVELTHAVERVIEDGLALFLEGRCNEARALLSTVRNEEIFASEFGKTRAYRLQAAVPIILAVLLFVLSIYSGEWRWGVPHGHSRWDGIPVSETMARGAIENWIRVEKPSAQADILNLWSGPAHPSLSLIGAENTIAYKRVVIEALKLGFNEQESGGVEAIIYQAMLQPSLLYHVVETPLLSSQELAELGFTPDRVRTTLANTTQEQRGELFHMRRASFQRVDEHAARNYQRLDIETFAKRLAVLKFFNALNFLDIDRIASEIATYQVDADFRAHDNFIPVDRELARGLFHMGRCGLGETWAALQALTALNRLDAIDREACIDAILRFYQGEGVFSVDHPLEKGIQIQGKDEDAFYAMESLALLKALERIQDFHEWEFQPLTQTITANHRTSPGHITGGSLQAWAYLERLEYHKQLWKNSALARPRTGLVSTGLSKLTALPVRPSLLSAYSSKARRACVSAVIVLGEMNQAIVLRWGL